MSSFKAELTIDGKSYKLQYCSFHYVQDVHTSGKPLSKICGGSISFVLEDPAPKEIIQWILNPTDKKNGSIRFYEVNSSIGTHQLLEFTNGYCTDFSNTFKGEKHNAGSLQSAFTINAGLLSFDGVDFER